MLWPLHLCRRKIYCYWNVINSCFVFQCCFHSKICSYSEFLLAACPRQPLLFVCQCQCFCCWYDYYFNNKILNLNPILKNSEACRDINSALDRPTHPVSKLQFFKISLTEACIHKTTPYSRLVGRYYTSPHA